jgi:hypothetical protein
MIVVETRQNVLAGGSEMATVVRVRHMSYSREVLVDIFCWLLEEAFKFIPSPLQTEQKGYMGQ